MAFRSNSPLVFRVAGEDADRPFCRICLESGPPEDFFKPCRCRGSAIGIHPACLQTWIQNAPTERAKTHCTVCDTEYVLSPPMKHSLTNFCRLIHHNSALTGIMLISVSATAAIPMPYYPYIFGAGIFCFLTWLFLIHIFVIYFTYPLPRNKIALRVFRGSTAGAFPVLTFGGCWIILYDQYPELQVAGLLVCLGIYFHCVCMWMHFVVDGYIKKIDREVLPFIEDVTDAIDVTDIIDVTSSSDAKDDQIIYSLAINVP